MDERHDERIVVRHGRRRIDGIVVDQRSARGRGQIERSLPQVVGDALVPNVDPNLPRRVAVLADVDRDSRLDDGVVVNPRVVTDRTDGVRLRTGSDRSGTGGENGNEGGGDQYGGQ